MTLRERIADWISGGAVSEARKKQQAYSRGAATLCNLFETASDERGYYKARLDRIKAQETPGANATVRRMARIARGEK